MISSSLGDSSGFTRPTGIGVRFRMASWMVPGVLPGKAVPACRHLVQDGAEREEVGAGVEVFATNLFRRHVRQRAHNRTGIGQVLLSRSCGHRQSIQRRPRQPEIEQLCVTAIGHEDVGRLDVAVNDSLGVGGFERIGELHAEFEDSIRRQRADGDELLQRGTLQQLHRHEMAAGVLPDVVDRADVWMIQRRGGAGLALEPFDSAGIPRQFFGEEFQRDGASEPRVFGQVDHSHATLTQFLQDAVVRDGLADHCLGSLGSFRRSKSKRRRKDECESREGQGLEDSCRLVRPSRIGCGHGAGNVQHHHPQKNHHTRQRRRQSRRRGDYQPAPPTISATPAKYVQNRPPPGTHDGTSVPTNSTERKC